MDPKNASSKEKVVVVLDDDFDEDEDDSWLAEVAELQCYRTPDRNADGQPRQKIIPSSKSSTCTVLRLDADMALALALQLDEDLLEEEGGGGETKCHGGDGAKSESDRSATLRRVIGPELELTDPNPNIWDLFRDFDGLFFNGSLTANGVVLEWSKQMTSCAGLCRWRPRDKFCNIRLSLPLLQFRGRSDLVETLLHEMIHALLFVTRTDDNHESHGPKFHSHMDRINRETGTNITVYHQFLDEVRFHKRHVWRCDGPCRDRRPYMGFVRRAMNRKPGPTDYWWNFHAHSCGGTFQKISDEKDEKAPRGLLKTRGRPRAADDHNGPPAAAKRPHKKKKNTNTESPSKSIKDFFSPTAKKSIASDQDPSPSTSGLQYNFVPFSGQGRTLSGQGNMPSSTSKSGVSRLLFRTSTTASTAATTTSSVATTTATKVATKTISSLGGHQVIELD